MDFSVSVMRVEGTVHRYELVLDLLKPRKSCYWSFYQCQLYSDISRKYSLWVFWSEHTADIVTKSRETDGMANMPQLMVIGICFLPFWNDALVHHGTERMALKGCLDS